MTINKREIVSEGIFFLQMLLLLYVQYSRFNSSLLYIVCLMHVHVHVAHTPRHKFQPSLTSPNLL